MKTININKVIREIENIKKALNNHQPIHHLYHIGVRYGLDEALIIIKDNIKEVGKNCSSCKYRGLMIPCDSCNDYNKYQEYKGFCRQWTI